MADAILTLPFVREATKEERKNGARARIFWDVQPTGDYRRDCDIGTSYAKQALAYIRAQDFPVLFNWAVFGMLDIGRERSGIEVGFLAFFANLSAASPLEAI